MTNNPEEPILEQLSLEQRFQYKVLCQQINGASREALALQLKERILTGFIRENYYREILKGALGIPFSSSSGGQPK